jgi:hypothetical protein
MTQGAYGKDTSQLNKVTPYGGSMSQRARHYAKQREHAASKRRGGGAPYWKDTFKCPTTMSRIIRLIPGQYEQEYSPDDDNIVKGVFEYVIFREHYHGATSRGAICSAGPLFKNKHKAEECPGCEMYWEDVRARQEKKRRGDKSKGPNRISLREQYVFSVWDYGLYIKLPRTDQHGNVVTGSQGTPFYDWVMADSNDPRQHQHEHKFGMLLAWPVGETYRDTLFSYNDETIQKDCSRCSAQGTVRTVSKICGNPNCEFEVYDPMNTTMNPEQIDKILSEPYNCPVCGVSSFIKDFAECSQCGMDAPRATIFDVDLQVKAVGTKGQQTVLQILARSEPRPIQVSDPEILKGIGPLDLIKKFQPTPPGKQRELWNLPAPQPQAQPQGPVHTGPPPVQQQPQPQMGAPQPPPMQQQQQQQQQQPVAPPASGSPPTPTMNTSLNMPGIPGFGNPGGQQ